MIRVTSCLCITYKPTEMARLNPTFKHIYDNKNLFGENEIHILDHFYKMNQNESGSKKIVFYTQGMEDEDFDDINVLDINQPLSTEYIDNILTNHLIMLSVSGVNYQDTWDDSRENFKKLGEICKIYLNRLPISECPICKTTIVEGTCRLTNCCRNNVHEHCLEEWRNIGVNGIACPLCRALNYGGAKKRKAVQKKKKKSKHIKKNKTRRQTKKKRN